MSGLLNRKAFGLLNHERNAAAAAPPAPHSGRDDTDANFATSLFEAAGQRLQLADGVVRVLSDDSAKRVRQQALQLQLQLNTMIRDISVQTNDQPQTARQKPVRRLGSTTTQSVNVGSSIGFSTESLASSARKPGSSRSQNPHPPARTKPATAARHARAQSTDRARPATVGSEESAAASAPSGELSEVVAWDSAASGKFPRISTAVEHPAQVDIQRERERSKQKDERIKVLQDKLREKDSDIAHLKEERAKAGRAATAATEKLSKREEKLRSLSAVQRRAESEANARINALEDEVATASNKLQLGQDENLHEVIHRVSSDLDQAMSKCIHLQQQNANLELKLTNKSKKVHVLNDKIELLESKELGTEAARDDLQAQLEAFDARARRAENKCTMLETRIRKSEEVAAETKSAASSLEAMVRQADNGLREKDAVEMRLTSKVDGLERTVKEKDTELQRVRALLKIAAEENDKAIEVEQALSTEKRKCQQKETETTRGHAKNQVLAAKLEKELGRNAEMRSDLAAQSRLVVEADKRIVQIQATMMRKDTVVDKAAIDTGDRLRTLQNSEREIRELHKELDRHDLDLAERDKKVEEAQNAVASARKEARRAVEFVRADAVREIAALEEDAAAQVLAIKQESVADDMMESTGKIIEESTREAAAARAMLEEVVLEVEKHRNTSVTLLRHIQAGRLERDRLEGQMQYYAKMQSEMFSTVVESAALKAELDKARASNRAFRLRYAVAMTKLEGLTEQIKVLRDEEDDRQNELAQKEQNAAAAAAEDAKVAALIFGDPDFLKSEIKRFLEIEKDIDRTKGQRNKALEQQGASNRRAADLQSEMILSCAMQCVEKLISDVEVLDAEGKAANSKAAEEAATNLADELQTETNQLMEMLESEQDASQGLQNALAEQISDKEHIMTDMGSREAMMVALQDEMACSADDYTELAMKLGAANDKLAAGRAREDALRKGMAEITSVRVVDYMLSRADLCPISLVTAVEEDLEGSFREKAIQPRTAGEHMVDAATEASAAYSGLAEWRESQLSSKAFLPPTTDETIQYASVLGVDAESEAQFLWMSEEAQWAPVGGGWSEVVRDEEGELYEDRLYYIDAVGQEATAHPLIPHYKDVLASLRAIDTELLTRAGQMCDELRLSPPAESVKDTWQESVESGIVDLFRVAVRRHTVMRAHYNFMAALVGDPSSPPMMSQRLRAHRSGAKKKKKVVKKTTADSAHAQLGAAGRWRKLESATDRVATMAGKIGSSSEAEPQLLRVLGKPVVSKLLLAGGAATKTSSGERPPTVQWLRSKHGVAAPAGHEDFELILRASTLAYTPSALDAGKHLRVVVIPNVDPHEVPKAVHLSVGLVSVDRSVAEAVETIVQTGVLTVELATARDSAPRVLVVQAGVGGRVEIRDPTAAGLAGLDRQGLLLAQSMSQVVAEINYDYPHAICLQDAETGDILNCGEEKKAATLVAATAAERDRVLLCVRGLQQRVT